MSEPLALLARIRSDIEAAVDVFLEEASGGLQDLPAVAGGDAEAAARLEARLLRILEGCAFQDLAGQRLDQLAAKLDPASPGQTGADPLLNGPALDGQGLDQASADRLFADT